jgi:predicted secreted protein
VWEEGGHIMQAKFAFMSVLTISVLIYCNNNVSYYKSVRIGTESDNSTINLNTFDTLVISLSSNQTTGYSWQIVKIDTSIVKEIKRNYQENQPANPGSGGTDNIFFGLAGPGNSEIKMNYSNIDGSIADSFFVRLNVTTLMPD